MPNTSSFLGIDNSNKCVFCILSIWFHSLDTSFEISTPNHDTFWSFQLATIEILRIGFLRNHMKTKFFHIRNDPYVRYFIISPLYPMHWTHWTESDKNISGRWNYSLCRIYCDSSKNSNDRKPLDGWIWPAAYIFPVYCGQIDREIRSKKFLLLINCNVSNLEKRLNLITGTE